MLLSSQVPIEMLGKVRADYTDTLDFCRRELDTLGSGASFPTTDYGHRIKRPAKTIVPARLYPQSPSPSSQRLLFIRLLGPQSGYRPVVLDIKGYQWRSPAHRGCRNQHIQQTNVMR